MVHVVVGIIVREKRILLTQRREDQSYPLDWECPGGKAQDDEAPEAALRRELFEELGVRVDDFEIDTPAVWKGVLWEGLDIEFFRLRDLRSRVVAREGQGLGWFTVSEMTYLSLAPGNQRAIAAIVRSMFEL